MHDTAALDHPGRRGGGIFFFFSFACSGHFVACIRSAFVVMTWDRCSESLGGNFAYSELLPYVFALLR